MSALTKGKLLTATLATSMVLLFSRGEASADSIRFDLSIGSPPPPVVVYEYPRVVYPRPVIVETYPVYYYEYRARPHFRASAHGHWKKHGHPRFHHRDRD